MAVTTTIRVGGSLRLFATVIPRQSSQIMRARCRAPYHIQAPTTAQRNGQGLRTKRIGKARGRLFSTLMDFHSLRGFNRWTKENARLEELSRCSRASLCLRGSNQENSRPTHDLRLIGLPNQNGECDVSNCAVIPYSKCCRGLQLVARILSLDSSDDEYRLAGAVDL